MKFYRIPEINPSDSIVWLELRILLPFTSNFFLTFYNKILMKYGKKFDEDRYNYGRMLYLNQPPEKRNLINTLFYNFLQDGYEVHIITRYDEKITLGFFNSLPSEISPNLENLHPSCSSGKKVEVVRKLKKMKEVVMGLGFSREDEKALEESNYGFIVNRFYFGRKFENLESLENINSMLHAIYFTNILQNRNRHLTLKIQKNKY